MAIVHRRSDGGPYSIMSNGCTVWQAAMKSPKDRKSTRLNSSHSQISYAVFCLKKKKKRGIESADKYYSKPSPQGCGIAHAECDIARRAFIHCLLAGTCVLTDRLHQARYDSKA